MTYTLWATAGTPTAPQEVLVKEDVTPEIINLFPDDTPLHQWVGRIEMGQVLKEFPVDTLANVTRTNASIALGSDAVLKQSGSAAAYVTESYPHKIRGINQIHQDAWSVSGTDRAAEMYGMADRFTYEGSRVGRKQMVDFELRAHWARGTNPAGNTVTATGTVAAGNNRRQTQGLASWILTGGLERGKGLTSNVFNTSGELLRLSATLDFRPHAHDANGNQLDEHMWNQQLMSPWRRLAKGVTKSNVALMGSKPKFAFRTFALTPNGAVNQRTIPADNKRIIDTVEVYETDHGVTFLNYDLYMDLAETTTYTLFDSSTVIVPWDETILVFNPSFYKIGQFRPLEFSSLGKDGDRDNGMYTMEAGFLCTHPYGGAALTNCIAA